ncbi:hypothetical protein PVL29_024415 [Vitis rotundifolia]|uniref:Serine incorporator n=1 Tax=Vitis rotundifolia TaxID=103349 RepID=A0AA39D9C4_VITRO|nr:hypothetical protein PVL29_024415 [Vitis rotundifolia]
MKSQSAWPLSFFSTFIGHHTHFKTHISFFPIHPNSFLSLPYITHSTNDNPCKYPTTHPLILPLTPWSSPSLFHLRFRFQLLLLTATPRIYTGGYSLIPPGVRDCLGAEGILHVRLGCFTLYFIMFLSIVGTSKLHKLRELWHSGWEIARFGVGVFLLIQLISIINFIKWLNDYCHSEKYSDRCHVHVMLLITTAYTYIDESLLTPKLMGLYVVFLCYEPLEDGCNQKAESATKANWLAIISFIIALLAMVIVKFPTSIDSKCFQLRKDDTQAEDDVPYGYGFFHFVCATGTMHFSITWVRIMNKWLAACQAIYTTPLIFKMF